MDDVVVGAASALATTHELYARVGGGDSNAAASRPPVYKVIGISLAIASGAFIGTSFVLKKVGLLRANEKYNEVAGEGYGYLKNAFWWSGMILMIIGEVCNFVAYAFTDAILVTPLGALSVVITTILSAIFLKERLSMVGKVACFLCIVGSVVIVMNAPQESSVATIQDMQRFVVTPGFLSFTGVVIIGSIVCALWAGPRWGKKNMMVYLSICSWIGGLSVVATQGLGAAIVTQAGGTPQFNQWFLYVLLVFVIATLLTEIIYLNVSCIVARWIPLGHATNKLCRKPSISSTRPWSRRHTTSISPARPSSPHRCCSKALRERRPLSSPLSTAS
jgi:magnesium transporter